jgi:hypothetical protein
MKPRFRFGLIAVAVTVFLCMTPISAVCQQTSASVPQNASNDDAKKNSPPTPRLADGRPDLNGFWRGAVARTAANLPPGCPGPRCQVVRVQHGDHVEIRVGDNDAPAVLNAAHNGPAAETQRTDPNPPPYKPELMAKVSDLEKDRYHLDPAFVCKPAGIPRVGPPNAIFQSSGMPIVFLYDLSSGNTYRVIPVDGRPHDPDADPTYFGDSIGHWEGDTLVVDTIDLNDDTWLGQAGWFHSEALHVIERITRNGDTIRYQATVEDPNVLTRPWVMNPRTLEPTKEYPVENPPCMDKDQSTIIGEANIVDQKSK